MSSPKLTNVMCQHIGDSHHTLTLGQRYKILSEDDDSYYVALGKGRGGWYVKKECFAKEISNGGNMFDSVKEYVKENRSILMTIGVALLVDHLVFGGAFREKVKSIIDSMLNTAQKKLDKAE